MRGKTPRHLTIRQWAIAILPVVVVTVLAAAQTREAFEVVSVKPMGNVVAPINGGRGGAPIVSGARIDPLQTCNKRTQIFPGRLVISNTTVYGLVSLAYGQSCLVLQGGDVWTRSARFELQAVVPEGTPTYRLWQLQQHDAPRLQAMLQTLLEDRFKLRFHRETREMPVYNLVVARSGKNLRPSKNPNPPDFSELPPELDGPQTGPSLRATAMSMSRLSDVISTWAGRPVIDRTNLTGLFDLRVDYDADFIASDPFAAHISAIQEQLGLKLEPARATIEVLVIDYVERPSEN
jgi:uncharacterized protein (TIGR03435 family)